MIAGCEQTIRHTLATVPVEPYGDSDGEAVRIDRIEDSEPSFRQKLVLFSVRELRHGFASKAYVFTDMQVDHSNSQHLVYAASLGSSLADPPQNPPAYSRGIVNTRCSGVEVVGDIKKGFSAAFQGGSGQVLAEVQRGGD